MIILFCGILLISCLFIILGPYRLYIHLELYQERRSLSVRIKSWKSFYTIEWSWTDGVSSFHGLLMKKWRVLKTKKIKGTEESRIKKGRSEERKREKDKKRLYRSFYRVLFDVPELIKRFFRNFCIDRFDIESIFGCDDPALTGHVYGLAQAVQKFQGKILHLSLIPHFTGAKFEGRATLILHFILLRLLWWSLRAGFQVACIYRKCGT